MTYLGESGALVNMVRCADELLAYKRNSKDLDYLVMAMAVLSELSGSRGTYIAVAAIG